MKRGGQREVGNARWWDWNTAWMNAGCRRMDVRKREIWACNEMTSKGKRERRSFHFLFPSFVLLFCIGSHTSDHTFPRDESGQKLVQAVWSVCVLLVLAVVDRMPWEGRWSGASLPFQAGRRERSAAWEKSRTFSCLWRKWHSYEITHLKSNKNNKNISNEKKYLSSSGKLNPIVPRGSNLDIKVCNQGPTPLPLIGNVRAV